MGQIARRGANQFEVKKRKDQQVKLLDTQEISANLVVDGMAKDAEILDLKEIVANLIISGGVA